MRGRLVANLVLRVIDYCKKVTDKEKLKQAEFVSNIFLTCWECTKTRFLDALYRQLKPEIRSDLKDVQGAVVLLCAIVSFF
jgi:hypothetical protein